MLIARSEAVQAEAVPDVVLKTMLPFDCIRDGKTRFGIVTIPPGARIPVKGLAPHDEDEYSILVKGTMVTTIGEVEHRIQAGDSTLILAGEAHAVYNDGEEECILVWALVRRS
jgi:quercetin dioxygenase-like cupin family protein